MKKPFLFILSIIIPLVGISQSTLINDIIDPSQVNQKLLYGSGGDQLTGDPYLFPKFYPGTLYLNKGGEIAVEAINLHTYHNLFVVEDEDGKRSSLSTYQIAMVNINEIEVNRSFVGIEEGKSTIYYENLYAGEKSNLLMKFTGKIVKGQQVDGYTSDDLSKDKIEKVTDFCIWLNKEKVIHLYGSKNAMIEKLSVAVGSDLKGYIKKNKLKLSKKQDLIELINHIDTSY